MCRWNLSGAADAAALPAARLYLLCGCSAPTRRRAAAALDTAAVAATPFHVVVALTPSHVGVARNSLPKRSCW